MRRVTSLADNSSYDKSSFQITKRFAMPHLRFRAETLDTLQQVRGLLLAELCELSGVKP